MLLLRLELGTVGDGMARSRATPARWRGVAAAAALGVLGLLTAAKPAGATCNLIDGKWAAEALASNGCSAAIADIAIDSDRLLKCNATGTVRYNGKDRTVCGTLVYVLNRNFTVAGQLQAKDDDIDLFKATYPSKSGNCEIEMDIATDDKQCTLRLQLRRKN
jgi:hypothetical protein